MAEESSPLIPKAAPMVAEPKLNRRWRNSWALLFGDGTPEDVASCCLSYHAPCVSFGWNQARGLQLSFWRELLRFLAFSLGAAILVKMLCCLVVMAACPPPVGPDGMMGGPGGMMHDGPGHEMDNRHTRMLLHTADASQTTDASDTSDTSDNSDTSDSSDGTDRWGPRHHWHHQPHMGMMIDQECLVRASPGLMAIVALALALFAFFVNFAARRRQALRERFGIEGTFTKDLALWAFCMPCALSQETRTLMHENVHEGIWHGPHGSTSVTGVPVMAPAKQCMV